MFCIYINRFIYTERTELKSLDEAENLSYAASKYILPTLFRICVEYMGDNLSPENVFRALEFGIFHNETELKVYIHLLLLVLLLLLSLHFSTYNLGKVLQNA